MNLYFNNLILNVFFIVSMNQCRMPNIFFYFMKSIEDEMDKNAGEGASNTVEERSDRILTPVQHCVYE